MMTIKTLYSVKDRVKIINVDLRESDYCFLAFGLAFGFAVGAVFLFAGALALFLTSSRRTAGFVHTSLVSVW